jgi:hypothetical protein
MARATSPGPACAGFRFSSDPLVGELLGGDHGSEARQWRTHEDGSRTSLGAVLGQRLRYRSSRGPPGLFNSAEVWPRAGSEPPLLSLEGGGDEETRTPDLLLAKEMLYQLSYVPLASREVWWAFLDSNQRPLPYQGSALTS